MGERQGGLATHYSANKWAVFEPGKFVNSNEQHQSGKEVSPIQALFMRNLFELLSASRLVDC